LESPVALVDHPSHPDTFAVPTSLVRRADRAIRRAGLAAGHRRALALLALTVVAVFIATAFGLPLVAGWVALAGSVAFVGFVGLHAVSPTHGDALYGPLGPPLEPEILPRDIAAPDIRAAYRSALQAHAKIRDLLHERQGTIEVLLDSYERCGELVLLAGRVARVGNALYGYVQEHDPNRLRADVINLRQRASEATDLQARRAYRRTADARIRQLQNYEEFRALQDRIQARIELIAASLESVQALVVKLHARILEQSAFAGDIRDGVDLLNDDLEVLEAAVDEALYDPLEEMSTIFPSLETLEQPVPPPLRQL
jgi:hypothetical protein